MEVVVRLAGRDDVDAIVDLIETLEPEAIVNDGLSRSDRRERFVSLMASGDNVELVADAGAEVVGEVSLARGGGLGPASLGFGVLARFRRRGIGTALLRACIETAREAGEHKLVGEVFPRNEAAIAFLQTLGFEREGYLRRHYRRQTGEMWDVLLMGLPLA